MAQKAPVRRNCEGSRSHRDGELKPIANAPLRLGRFPVFFGTGVIETNKRLQRQKYSWRKSAVASESPLTQGPRAATNENHVSHKRYRCSLLQKFMIFVQQEAVDRESEVLTSFTSVDVTSHEELLLRIP